MYKFYIFQSKELYENELTDLPFKIYLHKCIFSQIVFHIFNILSIYTTREEIIRKCKNRASRYAFEIKGKFIHEYENVVELHFYLRDEMKIFNSYSE